MRCLHVPAPTTPLRLDVFLTRALPPCSRRRAQQLIAAGAVRVNGRRVPKGVTVVGGDRVDVEDDWLVSLGLRPNPELPVRILYEDSAVLAVDKPPGLASQALRADETDTVANFLLARHPELATVGKTPLEAGIVHRLDTATSGVLLVARMAGAYAALRRQFSEHRVRKEYRALVHGNVAHASEIQTPIVAPRNSPRVRVCRAARPDGHAAHTRIEPLERYEGFTLLAVEISTGVRHQIRVHLASIGHPVVGDRSYGPTDVAGAGAVPRHLLHAFRLGFVHPESRKAIEIASPLPPDFTACLNTLRSQNTT